MTSIAFPMVSTPRPLLRFLRTPKGLLLIIFSALLAASCIRLDSNVVISNVLLAAVTAVAVDMPLNYLRRRRWILPDGAILTGVIVAFVFRLEARPLILAITVAVAILSKHAFRTRWSNVLNPAAFALVVAALLFNADQSWWGALPDLGMIGAVALIATGGLIAHRINKLPMILAFLGAYFALFAVASISRSSTVAETFITPDLQAALFFAFFMLDDPPTSPVRHEDQIVFGIIVAAVAYAVFMQFGGVYFLPAGLLAGNLWESGRRLVIGYLRDRETVDARKHRRTRLPAAGSVGAALCALPLVFASGVFASGEASQVASSNTPEAAASATAPTAVTGASVLAPTAAAARSNPFPFVSRFQSDLSGTYTQTNEPTQSHLVLDGLSTGELALGVHVELLQLIAVPPPDDESQEATPDDEAEEAKPVVTTSVNMAQLLDPASKGLLCDGKLTGLSGGAMRFSCDGTAAYAGVAMQIASQLNPTPDGTFDGTMTGQMRRTN